MFALFVKPAKPVIAKEEVETAESSQPTYNNFSTLFKETTEEIQPVLEKFKTVFPDDLPPGLPPERSSGSY